MIVCEDGLNTEDLSIEQLLSRYEALVDENRKLKEENSYLRARLGIQDVAPGIDQEELHPTPTALPTNGESVPHPSVTARSDVADKVRLFMSLFRGRNDVYARRWEGKKSDKSGYSPVCLNEWKAGACQKPRDTCARCGNKAYAPFDEGAVKSHLRGEVVAGIYPMLPDETCWFLAIDFDKGEWQKDLSALRGVCREKAKAPVGAPAPAGALCFSNRRRQDGTCRHGGLQQFWCLTLHPPTAARNRGNTAARWRLPDTPGGCC
jgi:hypothetical protein